MEKDGRCKKCGAPMVIYSFNKGKEQVNYYWACTKCDHKASSKEDLCNANDIMRSVCGTTSKMSV